MGETTVIWLAIAGGIIALTCALVCAAASIMLARSARHQRTGTRPHHAPPPMLVLPPQQPTTPLPAHPQTVMIVPVPVQPQLVPAALPAPQAAPSDQAVVLRGSYPQLGRALGSWLQSERDELERVRIAGDLGRLGSADAAQALLDGVRTGVITPTIAADNLAQGGFDAGIAVAAALNDPEPRVRSLATTLVGRRAPLTRMQPPGPQQPPIS